MAQIKYQVTLAIDGKHSVSVASDQPEAVTEGLIWAQKTYKQLVTMQGVGPIKGDEYEERVEAPKVSEPEETLDCGIHGVPMTWVPKNGGFWSCHQKNADGSWCKYRPSKDDARRMIEAIRL